MLNNKAFTMVELMVTVVIISVCLVMALRVFSICAAAVSEAFNTTIAFDFLQEEMDKVQEKAILQGGLKLSSSSKDVVVSNRKFSFKQDITQWMIEVESSDESEEEDKIATDLCEVELSISWRGAGKSKSLVSKTLIPVSNLIRDES